MNRSWDSATMNRLRDSSKKSYPWEGATKNGLWGRAVQKEKALETASQGIAHG
ncbi:hypothetical protein CHS0354_025029, partial [Potamilus streckersoni]